jgi:hypothetical protein
VFNALTSVFTQPSFPGKGATCQSQHSKAEMRSIAKLNSVPPFVYQRLVGGRCRSGRAIHQLRSINKVRIDSICRICTSVPCFGTPLTRGSDLIRFIRIRIRGRGKAWQCIQKVKASSTERYQVMMLLVRVDEDDAPNFRKLVTFPRKLVLNTGKEYERDA